MDSSHALFFGLATAINSYWHFKSSNSVAEAANQLDRCINAAATQILNQEEADPCASERYALNQKNIEYYAVAATFVMIISATAILCCKKPADKIKTA